MERILLPLEGMEVTTAEPDLVTALAERLEAIEDAHRPLSCGRALAREALAFVAERLPTLAQVELLLKDAHACGWDEDECCRDGIDALLRDLRERLGVK